METFRAFLAIDLDAATNKTIVELINALKKNSEYQQLKWTRPENLHLTLRFLGNITQEQYEQLIIKLQNDLKNFTEFELEFPTIFLFPSKEQQVALALKPEPVSTLIKLNQILEKAAIACEIKPEPRQFIPHLTLGKIKGKPIQELKPIKLPNLKTLIKQVKLYRSETSKEGSVYTLLQEFYLKVKTPNKITKKIFEETDKGIGIIKCKNIDDLFE